MLSFGFVVSQSKMKSHVRACVCVSYRYCEWWRGGIDGGKRGKFCLRLTVERILVARTGYAHLSFHHHHHLLEIRKIHRTHSCIQYWHIDGQSNDYKSRLTIEVQPEKIIQHARTMIATHQTHSNQRRKTHWKRYFSGGNASQRSSLIKYLTRYPDESTHGKCFF